MLLNFLFALAAEVPLTTDIEVSSAVVAAVKDLRGEPAALEAELRALAGAGDRTATALLGEMAWMPDRDGGPDYKRGCDYHEAAGAHPSALHNFATCHFLGQGRPRDLGKARALYRQSADLGFAKAACALGNMLVRGEGGPKAPATGLDLCRRAADAGEPDAQTDYGGYLLIGEFAPRDAVAARRYLEPAARRGQPNAAFLLGQIHWKGDGTEKDRSEAARWWRVAHDAGRPDAAGLLAMEALARLAEAHEGGGIPPAILAEARQWLEIAARQDPDPQERKKAAERLAMLAQLKPQR